MILDDREISISKFSKVCMYCENLLSVKDRKCKAFDSIPLEIWEGRNKHTKPLKDQQNDIVFTEKSK
jgi:hypothetical protein